MTCQGIPHKIKRESVIESLMVDYFMALIRYASRGKGQNSIPLLSGKREFAVGKTFPLKTRTRANSMLSQTRLMYLASILKSPLQHARQYQTLY